MILRSLIQKPKDRFTKAGFTLIEMLVVVFIFSVVGILVTRSVQLSLRATRKSEVASEVRSEVDYALNVIERHLRGAESIDSTTCTSSNFDFVSDEGSGSFSCSGGRIFLNGEPLTGQKVSIDCSSLFDCQFPEGRPDYVVVAVDAESAESVGDENVSVNFSTRITLRNYE